MLKARHHSRRILYTLLFLLFAALAVAGRVWALRHVHVQPDAWTEVQARGRLLVGTDPTYMPFSGYQGDYTGLEPELMREIAKRLGVEIQFFGFGGDGLYEALQVGQVDALASQVVIDPQRLGTCIYSTPYFDAGQVLAVRASSALSATADLSGRTLAVELGSDGDAEARRLAWRLSRGLTILHTDTPGAALDALGAGSADAAIVDHLSAMEYLRDHAGLRLGDAPVTSEPYAVVTRRDSPELARRVEAALQAMRDDGTLAALYARWLP